MEKEDRVKIAIEQDRKSTINLGMPLVESMMKDYHGRPRAGTPKGDLIDFSSKKKRAALLMIFYNPRSDLGFGLGLKEIAKIAGVHLGVLRIWRTEEPFKKAASEACDEAGKLIQNTHYLKFIREADEPFKTALAKAKKEIKKRRIKVTEIDESGKTSLERSRLKIEDLGDPDEVIDTLTRTLLHFNPLVADPIIEDLRAGIDMGIEGYLRIALILRVGREVTDEKSLRRWQARPAIKELTKTMIKSWIKEISDPEARKQLGPEKVQKAAEDLKTFIFQELNLL
jgi:hypothetical protein